MADIKNITEAIETLKQIVTSLPVAIQIDDTLTQSGYAADAKVVGDTIKEQFTYSSADLTAGVSTLKTGKLYFVYE